MSFHMDDDELREELVNGSKVIKRTRPPSDEPEPEEADPVAEAIEELTEAVQSLANRPVAPAPQISVAAPKVSVNIPAEKPDPRKWRFDVTERDRDGKIKSVEITAVD